MQLLGFFLLQMFIVVTYAQISLIIRDYFLYKKVTRVVGFSCGDVEDDFHTMKLLNDIGISTAIRPAGLQVDLLRYLRTDWTLGVFVDVRCPNQNVSGIFDEASAHHMFDYSYNWLILGSNRSHSVDTLNDTSFSIVTDLAILLPDESDYILYDVYNLCKIRGSALNVTKLGTWQKDGGLVITLTGSKIARRRNFRGLRAISIGIVLHRPENMSLVDYLEGDSYEVMDNWPKFGHTMLSHVGDMFNFTLDVMEHTRWEKNDSVGPVMNTLKRGEADLGYYPSILTIERYGYARVILPQWPTRTCFMFRTIPEMKMKPWIILKPFAVDTWYMIIVIVVVTVLLLSFILKLEHAEDYGYSISALITVAALCQQGVPTFTDQTASRIAFIQITVFGLLVYNYYSAAIVSARLNEPLQKMNDSLYSLIRSKMPLAAEMNIFFDFLLRNPRPEVQYFKRYWNRIPESKRFLTIEEGVERMKKGGFAYHADPDDIYPTISHAFDKQMICQLTEVHLLAPSELGLWTNHKSQFHEISKIGLIKISTSGLRRREIRRRMAMKPYCPTDELFVSSITIYEAAPILILLLFGMLISLIVLAMEYLIFHVTSSKPTKLDIKSHKKNKILLSQDKRAFKGKKNVFVVPQASSLFHKALLTK